MSIQQNFLKPVKLRTLTGFSFYDYNDIACVEADEHQAMVYTSMGERIPVFASLTSIQKQLPNDRFYKCHRSFIVNLSKVTGYNSKLRLISFDSYQIPVSRLRVKEFLGFFQHYAKIEGKSGKNYPV